MYRLKYLTLISCLVLAMGVAAQDEPKESHMQDSGKSHKKWVPFDLVLRDISVWRDDGVHEYACQILDWNIMANPHPVLKIMIPPSTIFSPIRIAFKLSWKRDPLYCKTWILTHSLTLPATKWHPSNTTACYS